MCVCISIYFFRHHRTPSRQQSMWSQPSAAHANVAQEWFPVCMLAAHMVTKLSAYVNRLRPFRQPRLWPRSRQKEQRVNLKLQRYVHLS